MERGGRPARGRAGRFDPDQLHHLRYPPNRSTASPSIEATLEPTTSGGLGGATMAPPRSWSAPGPARGRAGQFDPGQLHHAVHRRQTPSHHEIIGEEKGGYRSTVASGQFVITL